MLPFKFKGFTGHIFRGTHPDESECWLFNDLDGQRVTMITSMIHFPPMPNDLFVKTYSENKGLLEALLEHKYVEDTTVRLTVGFAIDGIAVVKKLVTPPLLYGTDVRKMAGNITR